MKCFHLFVLIGFLAFVSCQRDLEIGNDAQLDLLAFFDDSNLTIDSLSINKEDALKIVEPITSKYPDRWVDISNTIIPAGTRIAFNTMGHQLDVDDCSYCQSPDYDSWLIVIDNDVSVTGTWQLTHIFVDVKTGRYSTMELNGRAIIKWDTSRNVYIPSENINDAGEKNKRLPKRTGAVTQWAVIISGGCDSLNNKSRYYNDCVNIYAKLTQVLGYSKNNIFCLISDGIDPGLDQRTGPNTYVSSNPDLDGDGINDIQYKANLASISSAFNTLSLLVSPGDEVLVFLTDHGGYGGYFYLWDDETLNPYQLNTELNKLGSSVKIDVVMGQCHSGAFVGSLAASNRTIAASCSATESAWAIEYQYNLFLHYWTEEIAYAAVNDDCYVSPSELFFSASQSVISYQTAQYSSTPADFGKKHSLVGEIIPFVSGSDYLTTTTNSLYTIVNNPNPSSVTWDTGLGISLVSFTDSTAVVKGSIPLPGQFCISSSYVDVYIVVDGKTHKIRKNIESVWKPGYYVDKGHIWGGNGTYTVRHIGGEYGYVWFSTSPAWPIVGYVTSTATVQEGYTSDPVSLGVSFYNPLGEQITILERVH